MEKISKARIKLVRSLQQKKFRDELGLFVAEGEKCVSELAKAFELVYRIQSTEYREQADSLSATPTEIEQMSGLRTPQGVIGVFRKKPLSALPLKGQEASLVLALDGVQDPGNLGTIIRTCDWFGVHDIFCSPDTADCYNPRVVQATMGALARVRVHYVNLPEWLEEPTSDDVLRTAAGSPIGQSPSPVKGRVNIYGTLLDGKDMYEVLSGEAGLSASSASGLCSVSEQCKRSIIIMGNEGNGISEAVRKLVTHPIRIPSYPKDAETSESLNVAAATAIVLAEFRAYGF